MFLRVAELLRIPPADCLVIEDSAAGAQAGNDAGMQVITITNSLPADRLGHADRVVSSYEQIAGLLIPST